MRRKIFFMGVLLSGIIGISTVNASSVSLSMSCPRAAKPNTEITCTVYGSSSGSNVDYVETIYTNPTGALKQSNYSITESLITTSGQKNIGKLTIQTGNTTGTGQIELIFDAIHFADGSYQEQTKVTKSIIINKTGKVTTNNRNNNSNSNSNRNNNNNTVSGTNTNPSHATSTDTYLQGIKVSRGILSPAFAKNVYNYTVKVDSDVDKITIDGIKNDVNQKVTGEVQDATLKYGKNTFTLVVSNGNAKKRTYEVVINREDGRDSDATLSSISLSSGTISFSPTVYNYEMKVLYDVESINVLATPSKTTSTVKVEGGNNLQVGDNLITITVRSQKGNEQKYVIKVTKLRAGETIGDNASIKNIKIDGYDFNFDSTKNDYKLIIKDEDKLIISVEMEDANAAYQIYGNENLTDGSVIQIVTTSFDGKSSETYTIEVTKPSYTAYYILGGVLVALAIAIPVVFFLRYGKAKKDLVDINGNRISKDELKAKSVDKSKYRKRLSTTIPIGKNNKDKTVVKSEKDDKQKQASASAAPQKVEEQANAPKPVVQNNGQVGVQSATNQEIGNQASPQFVVNIEDKKENVTSSDSPANMGVNQVVGQGFAGGKCPKCGRELLGNPDTCPYCNTKLK